MADQTNIEWCDSTFNPWVWAIHFEVIQRNVDDVLQELRT